MVTTKRQITKDSERYGHYTDNNSALLFDYDITNVDSIKDEGVSDAATDIDTDITNKEPAAAPQMTYTTIAPSIEKTPETVTLPPREKREMPHNQEDVLPTLKTQAYANIKPEAVETEKREKTPAARKGAMSGKMKLMLVAYVVVALALAIAVIVTGASISTASAAADSYSTRISQNQRKLSEQEEKLASMLDADAIRERAEELGMVQAGEPEYTVDGVESVGYPEATPRSDMFDKILDWFSTWLK